MKQAGVMVKDTLNVHALRLLFKFLQFRQSGLDSLRHLTGKYNHVLVIKALQKHSVLSEAKQGYKQFFYNITLL